MFWIMGIGEKISSLGTRTGGRKGSGISSAVSFAFDLRFSTLKKWEQDAQRQKKRRQSATL